MHVAELHHPLARAFDLPPVSRAGDANTVFATGGANYRQTAGASYREVIDLGDFDNSVAINVPGQSAQPGSEYYDDLLPLWGNDKYFPLVFSRARVEAETKHTLSLVPSGNGERKRGRCGPLPAPCSPFPAEWPGAESNRRHRDFQSRALPTELPGRGRRM